MRKGAMLRISAEGIVERNTSSKSRVKSKPPRHPNPAQGPKVLSTEAQFVVNTDAIEMTVALSLLTQDDVRGVW